MDSTDIAVIVTTHNYAHYLSACLQSVKSQTLSPKEILVVDDASEDDTADVVRGFPGANYARVVFRNGNKARNFGFSNVDAERVVFFDADNEMEPDFLETLNRTLDYDCSAGFAYSDRINFGEGDVSWYPEPMGLWKSRVFDALLIREHNYIDLASMMRASIFPGFDETLSRYQDWDLWLNIVIRCGGRGHYVPKPLYRYRVHSGSVSSREDRNRAVWHIRRKYRLGSYFSLPWVRDSFVLYNGLQRVKSGVSGLFSH